MVDERERDLGRGMWELGWQGGRVDVLWENGCLVVLDMGVRLVGERSNGDSTIVVDARGTAIDLCRVMAGEAGR